MSVYKVRNKHHIRATITEELAHDARGNTYVIRNAGRPVRYEVGALVDDLTPEELQAFPDRFELVDGEPLVLTHATPSRTINPALYALMERAYKGEATTDEQAIVGPLLAFLTAHAAGTATPEQQEALELQLAEFDLPLFV